MEFGIFNLMNRRHRSQEPAGHLSNIENPDVFNAALAEFLDEQPR